MKDNTLDAVAVSLDPKKRKGGSAPAHVWVVHSVAPFQCEGLNPLVPLERRRFSDRHEGHINRGERFLRKGWLKTDGTEFSTRHCGACGDELERLAGLNGNGARP